LISSYGVWNATNKRIRKIDIPMQGLSAEIKAALLTDIHIGHFWGVNTLQKVVNKTNSQNPDVVFITGDLFDGKIRLSKSSLKPLQDLNAPVYFVEGNHDGYSGAQEIKQKLRDIGVHVLENEVRELDELQIIGLNHMLADEEAIDMHAAGIRSTIKSTLNKLNITPNKPAVLLHHSPDGIKYANQHNVDLYLAGHTHAGQIFPVNFISRWIFEYNKGLHDYKGTKMYVSQGIGTFGPPMRVGTISEISILNLIPKE
ncbi:MAG: metallophosphoesterase, partial [Draconibacterium sp.]|nr:metallophosphoesterase [Draconibacterium sp.]